MGRVRDSPNSFSKDVSPLQCHPFVFSSIEHDDELIRNGLGNDFIILDARKNPKLSAAGEPKSATILTDRKIGIVREIFHILFAIRQILIPSKYFLCFSE